MSSGLRALLTTLEEVRHFDLADSLRFPTWLASHRWGHEPGTTIHLFDPHCDLNPLIANSNFPTREQTSLLQRNDIDALERYPSNWVRLN